MVLLGLRTVPKEDNNISTSEAVFGSPLTLPGEFLDSAELTPNLYLQKIEAAISGFQAPFHHRSQRSLVPDELMTAKFVFVREDAVSPPLTPLYRGPYLVLEHGPKFFKLQIGLKADTVSIDRLKPLIHTGEVTVNQPPRRGRPASSPPASIQQTPSPETPKSPEVKFSRPLPTRFQPPRRVKSVSTRPPRRPR